MATQRGSRADPGAQTGEQGPPSKAALPPDQPPAKDWVFSYPNVSSDAPQFAAGADGASPADQGYGPDVPESGNPGPQDADGLADGFPPDDGAVLWQGDLGVQGRFRTRIRVIGLEDGGQRARLLRELVFRPSRPAQEGDQSPAD